MSVSSTHRVPSKTSATSRSLSATVASATRSSPDPAGSQVFVAQGTGITLFLTIARSHDSVNATLLPVGTPHFFGEVTAATGGNAEHRDHRDGPQEAVRRASVNRPAARRLLPGRPDFVAAFTANLAKVRVTQKQNGNPPCQA